MATRHRLRFAAQCLAAGTGLAAVSYAAYAAAAWYRYGRATPDGGGEDGDALLDRFIPACEVAERHRIRVHAPAEIVVEAATEMDLQQSALVRSIFKARELIMCAHPPRHSETRQFLTQMRAIGWGVLAEVPGREIVMGAVARPWMADVVFRPLGPDEFAGFHEPDYVKIVWTLRADPLGAADSIFRTETRAITTDSAARVKFRRYWALASPGIILIRRALLGPLKAEAERRARLSLPDGESRAGNGAEATRRPSGVDGSGRSAARTR
jgi:hypothetical protein